MKKVLLVLALVVAYGITIAAFNTYVLVVDEQKVTVVADDNSPEKEKKETKKAEAAKSDAKAEGCSGKEAKKADCASSCEGKKTAEAKKDCASSCGGEKTAKK